MFGYVRPLTPELRVRELDMFRALYCGMCNTLGRKYGAAARLILSYDFVFLCALLWQPDERPRVEMRRCPVSVRKKRCVCNENRAAELAAGCGVILAWHKLRDNTRDDGLFSRFASRLAMAGLGRAYKKARRDFPEFDSSARERLDELSALEATENSRPDALANAFAELLAGVAGYEAEETRARIFHSLLYHLGRWLYYIDARDDLESDIKSGAPNPLRGGKPDDTALATTLSHSNSLISAAFELLPETALSDISRNIIYLGLPNTQEQVILGTAGQKRGYRNI